MLEFLRDPMWNGIAGILAFVGIALSLINKRSRSTSSGGEAGEVYHTASAQSVPNKNLWAGVVLTLIFGGVAVMLTGAWKDHLGGSAFPYVIIGGLLMGLGGLILGILEKGADNGMTVLSTLCLVAAGVLAILRFLF